VALSVPNGLTYVVVRSAKGSDDQVLGIACEPCGGICVTSDSPA
jgi:hypothetical protein